MKHFYYNHGFTLVEMLVIILIISVLSVLGFISFSNYTVEARNSTRISNLQSINKVITLKIASWENISQYVVSGQEVPWAYFWWKPAESHYRAWDIDFVWLQLLWPDYMDPLTNEYPKLWVTGLSWEIRYQLAGSIENIQGEAIAKVVWSYTPDTSLSPPEPLWLINAAWETDPKPVHEWSSDVVYDFDDEE